MSTLHADPVLLTQALIQCPSITPEEGGALNFLQSILEQMGFNCKRKVFSQTGSADVDNLYARLGEKKPNLCFAGHTDVVPPGDLSLWTFPPFSGKVHEGCLFGRGASDMKGAIGCFIAAISRISNLKKISNSGSLSLLITGDEEGPSVNGTVKMLRWLTEQGEKLDACLVGEPTNPNSLGDEIKIGRRGSLTGEILIHGRQGHSAYPHLAENPVPKLAHIIDCISNVMIDKGTPFFEPSNCQFTVLSVPNTAANVIPASARTLFNIRYNDLWSSNSIEDWLKLQLDAAAKQIDAKYSLHFSPSSEVFLMQKGPLVEGLCKAVTSVIDRVPSLTTGGGTSDARFIKDYCPVVEFGLTNRTIHQVNENVLLKDLDLLTDIYQRFILDFFANNP